MKRLLLLIVTIVAFFTIPKVNFGQIDLGAAANFALYTSGGAVHDNASSHSLVTGDVGYFTSGDFLGFGNVNGVMRPGVDAHTTAGELALQNVVVQINGTTNDYFPGLLLGNGVVYIPGVYSIPGNATLNLDMILDAQNNPNAEFIIKINGTFSTSAAAKVKLINGAQACRVFWLVQGQVDIATNSTMRGTIIANNAAINMATGDSLEGRLLSTTGAITIDGCTIYTPQGCGSPVLTGPIFPNLGSIVCYSIYSSNGALTNTIGTTTAIGDVGNNGIGAITGWDPAAVTGTLHLIQDPSTIQAAIDLSKLYDTLNAMIPDIELLYPAQFGNNLVLTPHVYIMNSAATFTDSLTLDAQGNADGVFVIKITGGSPALTTSTYSKVKLINGAQAKNVFWLINGAVNINNYSEFKGNIVVPNGAINLVNTGLVVDGRALTMVGAITTAGLEITMPPGCTPPNPPIITVEPANQTACVGESVSFNVTATGDGLTYQWRKGNTDLINGLTISGATTATLTIDPVSITDDALNYNVIVSGTFPPNDTSINVSLTVSEAPVITTEPMNQTVCAGSPATFSVLATDALTYQWRKGNTNLINGLTISGATTATLTIDPVSSTDAALNYNVIVSGACTPNDTSINVSLSVDEAPEVITQPINQTICEGDSVSFTVVATGANLIYQWRKGLIPLINGGNISGVNTPTLTINPATISDIATNYNVLITGGCVSTDTSSVGLITSGEFGILAGTDITSTGFSEIHDMDVGLSPGVRSQITGFPPAIVVNGAIYASDDIAPPGVAAMLIQAKQDLTDAYLYAEGATAPAPVTVAGDQGGKTLTPGIYKSTSTLLIQSGDLTLDAQGNVNAKWIFQIASDFTTIGGAGGNVILTGGAQADNITWQVGSSATIGNYTSFAGNILALTSITMNTGSSIDGRLLARNGAVVLSGTNIINGPSDSVAIVVSQEISVNVSLMVNPIPNVTSPATGSTCSGEAQNYNITASVSGTTYNWSRAAVIGISNISVSNQTNNPITEILTNTTQAPVNVIYLITPTANGCTGNTFVYTVTVYPVYISNNPQTICNGDSYMFNGHTYTVTGIYNDTLTSMHGCDSIIVTQLTVNPVYTINNPQTICDGDSYMFNGHTYTVAGNYNDTLTSMHGCDSIIITQLTVNPVYTINNPQTICDGDSYMFNGHTYTVTGIYNDTLTSMHGCDSIIITQLTVNPVYTINNPQTICDGDSYMFNGHTYTVAGNYNDTLTSMYGCDSIIVTQLMVNPVYTINNPQTICDGDSYVINGHAYTVAGNYTDTLYTVYGCDSIIITQLTVNIIPFAMASSNSPVCAGDPINFTAETVVGGNYQWTGPNNFASASQNPSIALSILSDAGIYTLIVELNGCFSLPSNVNVIVNNCIADLEVIKTADNMYPLIGKNVIFTIVATNNGPYDATGVIVNDILQSGFTYVSSTATAGTYNASTGDWTIGNMPVGTTEILTVTATVASSGSYFNTAEISGHESDNNIDNNISTIELIPVNFFIPEGYSPNGDGINDLFVIVGINYYPENTIIIFNRWGDKVFEASPYQNTWDGTSTIGIRMGGNELPIGTYFYLLDLGNSTDVIKGTIYLNR